MTESQFSYEEILVIDSSFIIDYIFISDDSFDTLYSR